MENTNLKIRTTVLEYSLQIESWINSLLLGHLDIFEKDKTKNFGNKAGISFKSKLDLLFDIGVLNLEEHKEIELLMNFRNKFLHDLDSNSFTKILNDFDSGIKNRFLKFLKLDVDPKKAIEKDYENACHNLFMSNLKIISQKYKARKENIINRTNYMTSLYDSSLFLSSISSDFAGEIMQITEKTNSENPILMSAFEPIIESFLKFSKDYEIYSKRILELQEKLEMLPKQKLPV